MREIMFRVWDKENNCFFEPTYEAYKGKLEFLKLGMSGRLSMMTLMGLTDESLFPDRFELMQYTGLKDKRGQEIYEGDILTDGWGKEQVIWDNASFVLIDKEGCYSSRCEYHRVKEYEVIGNIYENPELLE